MANLLTITNCELTVSAHRSSFLHGIFYWKVLKEIDPHTNAYAQANTHANNSQREMHVFTFSSFLMCDLNRTPNCYGKTWRLLCPFFRNLHLRENLARDCFTSTASTVTNSAQYISLPVYVIVTNTRLQPLTTTFYNSMLVSFSLLKI